MDQNHHPAPPRDPLDTAAEQIAYGVILAAVAKYGWTRKAFAAAFIAVSASDAFEESDHAAVPAGRDPGSPETGPAELSPDQ